jgi:hypothetical protein
MENGAKYELLFIVEDATFPSTYFRTNSEKLAVRFTNKLARLNDSRRGFIIVIILEMNQKNGAQEKSKYAFRWGGE